MSVPDEGSARVICWHVRLRRCFQDHLIDVELDELDVW